jgi:hypothetical protein
MKASALRAAFVIGAGYTLVAGPFACERRSGVGGNGASAGVENGSLPGVPGPRLPGGAQVGSSRSTNPGTAGAGTAGAPPGGDPGWQNVSWAPACNGVQVATDARYAVPELEWQACEGVPGCERLVVNWSSSINIPYQIASLYKRDGTLRLSMHMWFEQEWRKAVYADARTPIAAWRGPFGQAEHCGGLFIATTARGICLLMANEGQARQVVRSLAEPAGDPIAQFDTSAADSDGCMDQIFAGVSGGGSDFVLDISGGTQHEITPAAGTVFGLRPHADMVFFTRFDATGAQEVLDGWIWSNAGGSRRIVAPDGDNMVYDIRGDGNVVAWLEMPFTRDYNDKIAGELWTSPFATDEPSIARKRVRVVPETSIWPAGKALYGGHYALIEQHEDPNQRPPHDLPATVCFDRCELNAVPGRYLLRVSGPPGSDVHTSKRYFDLAGTSLVTIDPPSSFGRYLGLALGVAGPVLIVGGRFLR